MLQRLRDLSRVSSNLPGTQISRSSDGIEPLDGAIRLWCIWARDHWNAFNKTWTPLFLPRWFGEILWAVWRCEWGQVCWYGNGNFFWCIFPKVFRSVISCFRKRVGHGAKFWSWTNGLPALSFTALLGWTWSRGDSMFVSLVEHLAMFWHAIAICTCKDMHWKLARLHHHQACRIISTKSFNTSWLCVLLLATYLWYERPCRTWSKVQRHQNKKSPPATSCRKRSSWQWWPKSQQNALALQSRWGWICSFEIVFESLFSIK